MKHLAYIASGWFNPRQAQDLHNIKAALDNAIDDIGLLYTYYSPKDEIQCDPTAGAAERNLTFTSNIQAIRDSMCVIVNTRDKDMGTIFEAGVAYALGKPIIYFADGFEGNFNLMLAQSGIAVCTSVRDLENTISNFIDNPFMERPYNGVIE